MKRALLTLGLLLWSLTAAATGVGACVVATPVTHKNGVVDPNPHDGDTLTADCTGRKAPMVLRIADIDSPELHAFQWGDQPFAREAAASAQALCVPGQPVKVTLKKFDQRTSRWIAKVACRGQDLGEWQASHGWAWPYLYAPRSRVPALAAAAKAKHLGLWSDPAAVAPTVWRAKGMR